VTDETVRRANPFLRLYRGETRTDFVGRRRVWFAASLLIILVGMVSLGFRGLNLGIDFKGGDSWQVASKTVSQNEAMNAALTAGLPSPTVYILGGALGTRTITVEADLNNLSASAQLAESNKVVAALAALVALPHTTPNPNGVSTEVVGPTWGSGVTDRAIEALIAFFLAVVIYISIRFEPKMAGAAIVAVIHDLLVTVGVYSLFGFQVTPDTVVAILTILGYSLYDTVVVFDRVRDNARGVLTGGQLTYSDMVNLSMNQTLARSINTSMVAIIPVLSVLLVGAQLLGATTLQDYGLALFIGLTSGAYSSIFIASPLLAIMKEREPRFRELRQRVSMRADRVVLTPALAAAMGGDGGTAARPSVASRIASSSAVTGASRARRPTAVTPRGRKPKKK
jgi:preprotein translocase subunit SecF